MRLRLSSCFAAIFGVAFCNSAFGGEEIAFDPADAIQNVEACLEAVRNPHVIRQQLDHNVLSWPIEANLAPPLSLRGVTFKHEHHKGVHVATCSSPLRGPSLYPELDYFLTNRESERLHEIADRAELIQIHLKAPGLYFADCQNSPHASVAIAVTPRGKNKPLSFLVSRSPAVGAVCAHSYGMQ